MHYIKLFVEQMKLQNNILTYIICLALFSSIYSLFILFVNANPIWIAVGLCLILSILIFTNGIYSFTLRISLSNKFEKIIPTILALVLAVNLISSIHGFINLLFLIPTNDKSILFVPIVIVIFLFTGSFIRILGGEKIG